MVTQTNQTQNFQNDNGKNKKTNGKSKKAVAILFVLLVAILAIVSLAGCQAISVEDEKPHSIPIDTNQLFIDEENMTMSATVGSSVNVFSIANDIIIPEGATIFLVNDYFPTEDLTVVLKEGENKFNIVIKKDGIEREYQVIIYRKRSFEVHFDAQNNTPIKTIKVEEGDVVTPPVVTKRGCVFSRWSVDVTEPVKNSFTAYAVWTASQYTLTIDANGGNSSVETVSATYNSNVDIPTPTREGYVFASWRIKSTNEPYYGGKWVISHDDTLIAQWVVRFYAVTVGKELINATNGEGTCTIKGAGNYRLNDQCTLNVQPNKGYEYVGLYNGNTLLTTDTAYSFTIKNPNVSLVAKFKAKIDEMTNFYFTTENEKDDYVITGLRNTDTIIISVPECVVGIKQGAFADVVRKIVNYTAPFTGGSATENGFLTYVFGASADNIKDVHYIPEKLSYAHITRIIGDHAFDGFTALTSCTVDISVRKIGDYAFYGCAELISLSGEEYATEIGEYAFAGCSSLTTAYLNVNLTEIKAHTFENTALTSISLPKKVTKIGDYAFNHCVNMRTLYGIEYATEIGEYAFCCCDLSVPIVFNDNLTEIKNNAFEVNSLLTTIDWPENLTTIGDNAFRHCINIITVSLPSIQSIGDYAFSSCISVNSVSFGNSLKDIGVAAFWDTNIKTVTIPASVENISSDVFRSCKRLEEVNFAEDGNLKDIGSRAFASTAITSVDIPASVENIYRTAFGYCKKLATVNFVPNGNLKRIENMAFAGCPIEEFIVPDTVEFLGMQILSYNEVIEVLSVPFVGTNRKKDNCQPLDYFFFDDFSPSYSNKYVPKSLKKVSITDAEYLYLQNSVSSIGTTSVFYNCTSITDIYIAPTLKETPFNVFNGCTSLATLACPVMQDLFSALFHEVVPVSLKEVTLLYGERSKIVPNSYFENCNDIEKVVLQGNFTSIGLGAFKNCTSLKEITIPQSVVSIERIAFLNCSKLDNITFEDTQNWEYFDEVNEKHISIDVTDKTTVIDILIKNGCKFWKIRE